MLEYLDHIILEEGMKVDRLKVRAMIKWLQPKILRKL